MAAKNGYYGSLVPMVRDAFLCSELVRIDCQGLEKSDYKKIGCKLRVKDLMFKSFCMRISLVRQYDLLIHLIFFISNSCTHLLAVENEKKEWFPHLTLD